MLTGLCLQHLPNISLELGPPHFEDSIENLGIQSILSQGLIDHPHNPVHLSSIEGSSLELRERPLKTGWRHTEEDGAHPRMRELL